MLIKKKIRAQADLKRTPKIARMFPFFRDRDAHPHPFPLISSKTHSRAAVQKAQVAVPANANYIDKQHAVVERHKSEVDGLHEGPDHPVGRQGRLVVLVELVLHGAALEHGHAAQEGADGDGGEDALVESDARGGRGLGGLEVHVAREELEPGGCGGAKDGCCVVDGGDRVSLVFVVVSMMKGTCVCMGVCEGE